MKLNMVFWRFGRKNRTDAILGPRSIDAVGTKSTGEKIEAMRVGGKNPEIDGPVIRRTIYYSPWCSLFLAALGFSTIA